MMRLSFHTFFVLHGSILFLLLLGLQAMIFFAPGTTGGLEVTAMQYWLVAVATFYLLVASAEQLVMVVARLTSAQIARRIFVTWSLLLVLISVVLTIDMLSLRFMGSFADQQLVAYGFQNFRQLIPVVSVTVPAYAWFALLVFLIAGMSLTYLSWHVRRFDSDTVITTTPLLVTLIVLIAAIGLVRYTWPDVTREMAIMGRLPGLETATTYATEVTDENRAINKKAWELLQLVSDDTNRVTTMSNQVALTKTPTTRYFNIVLVLLETARSDAISAYNPSLQTTPFLDRMANEGIKVENGYVSLPHSSKSMYSMPCGIPAYPEVTVIESEKDREPPRECLPHLLRPFGYQSGFFTPQTKEFENSVDLVANIGFDTLVAQEDIDQKHWEEVNYFGYEDMALVEPFMQWVDEQGDSPFFATILTAASHHPYNVPSSFSSHTKHYVGTHDWSNYLNTVAYTDFFLAEIFQEFEERSLDNNTLFIFVGDHGEDFGQHGFAGHGFNVYNNSIRIPYILWNKELIPEPIVVGGPHLDIDIVPTIIDLLGFEQTGGFPGISVVQQPEKRGVHTTCIFRLCHGLVSRDLKFIYNGPNEPPELYDLTTDPHEYSNRINDLSENIVNLLMKDAVTWREKVSSYYN